MKCSECHRRSDISSSGILPALAQLALHYNHYQDSTPASTEGVSLSAKFQQMTGRATPQKAHNGWVPSINAKRAVPSANILTPARAEFVYLCTIAAQYHYASQFLANHPIYAVGPPSASHPSNTTSEVYLRYFYHVGAVHCACDEFQKAIGAWRNCITVPSKAVSAITVQARKKSLLASCLLLEKEDEESFTVITSSHSSLSKKKKNVAASGKEKQASQLAVKLLSYPDSTSPVVSRYFVNVSEGASPTGMAGEATGGLSLEKASGTTSTPPYANASLMVYDNLVIAFASFDFDEFDRILNTHAEVWEDDRNLGLVKRVEALMKQRKIRKLSKIYKAIPLQKLQTVLGLDSDDDLTPNKIESLLMQIAFQQEQMTNSSSPLTRMPIDFSIDSEKSQSYFYLDGEYGEDREEGGMDRMEREQVQAELSKRISTCMKLAERVSNLDIAVAVSGKYQAAVIKDEKIKPTPRSVVDSIVDMA